jgi:hypothetical protein
VGLFCEYVRSQSRPSFFVWSGRDAVGTVAVTLVGSIVCFTRACYQRFTALSNLSDPSADQSVTITSAKGNLEWMWEHAGAAMFYCVGSRLGRAPTM